MSKEMKELQKRWNSMMDAVHSNSHVVAFMNSRVGRYLDDHPFVALSLLIFMAASALPVAFFLLFVAVTAVTACVGVILMEGFLITLGGVTLFCVLGGLGMLSLAVSGVLSVCYISLTTLLNYWPVPKSLSKKEIGNGSAFLPSSPLDIDQDAANKKSE
ncbi:lipid droplet assembly factor 1 [Anolis carolinensis]|uniref:Lipid droplet assembly factor 1 n=1 Tax=Anolis carolinensis TaxID=28377 RepID=R4GAG0_ANOCA|nr:PREDICTED: promethin [Anolis carolinensis]XP_003226746.1 PREDICTED: promethin [Anolis carolinensis]XP_008117826.1 PREDICTED: promethin [Anolis carolinensis]|eukprot:XP_003226745.1 PREDICTED: promethin [Anolis carolinensis]